jgi:hypothetical protein
MCFILKIYTIIEHTIYYAYVSYSIFSKIYKLEFLKLKKKKNSERATWSPGSILSFRIFFVYTNIVLHPIGNKCR